MKQNTVPRIEEALKRAGVKNTKAAAEEVYRELFVGRETVPAVLVIDALDEVKGRPDTFQNFTWLASKVGVARSYFYVLRYTKGNMSYEVARKCCEVAGLDLEALLQSEA